MAAYVLARSESRWMQVIYLFIVAGFAVPVTAVLVPLYQMLSAAGLLNSRLGIVAALRRLRHPVHHHPLLRLLPRLPARARGGRAARRLRPHPDPLPHHPAALRPGGGERRDLPGGVHLERVPARAADADAPGAQDAAGRHPAAPGRVHLRLAGGDGGARHRHAADPRSSSCSLQKYFVRSLAGLGK